MLQKLRDEIQQMFPAHVCHPHYYNMPPDFHIFGELVTPTMQTGSDLEHGFLGKQRGLMKRLEAGLLFRERCGVRHCARNNRAVLSVMHCVNVVWVWTVVEQVSLLLGASWNGASCPEDIARERWAWDGWKDGSLPIPHLPIPYLNTHSLQRQEEQEYQQQTIKNHTKEADEEQQQNKVSYLIRRRRRRNNPESYIRRRRRTNNQESYIRRRNNLES